MTDEEFEAIEKQVQEHDTNSTCLAMLACCSVGTGEVTTVLLAEVKRLRSYEAASNRIAALLVESATIMAYGDQEPDA